MSRLILFVFILNAFYQIVDDPEELPEVPFVQIELVDGFVLDLVAGQKRLNRLGNSLGRAHGNLNGLARRSNWTGENPEFVACGFAKAVLAHFDESDSDQRISLVLKGFVQFYL